MAKCPTCQSPQPHLHPAIQCEGEVQICKDAWHTPQAGETPRAEETPLGRALRRIAKGRRLTSLDVPVLDDAADLVDQLTAEVKTRDEQIARLRAGFCEAHSPEPGVCPCCEAVHQADTAQALREALERAKTFIGYARYEL